MTQWVRLQHIFSCLEHTMMKNTGDDIHVHKSWKAEKDIKRIIEGHVSISERIVEIWCHQTLRPSFASCFMPHHNFQLSGLYTYTLKVFYDKNICQRSWDLLFRIVPGCKHREFPSKFIKISFTVEDSRPTFFYYMLWLCLLKWEADVTHLRVAWPATISESLKKALRSSLRKRANVLW